MSGDRYVYPGTNVLRNKLDITDERQLYNMERDITAGRIFELRNEGITGTFDASHLKDIHKRIFGDVYDWAGEFRDIQIWKGGTEFAAPDEIGGRLEKMCAGIRAKNYFRDMSHDEAANTMADTMAELNLIHPFREGNGRAQRAFLGQLALNAGYDLDFTKMSENDMRNASMSANRGQMNLMRYLFRDALSDRIYEPGPVIGVTKTQPGPDAPAEPRKTSGAMSRLRRILSGAGRGDPDKNGPGGPEP